VLRKFRQATTRDRWFFLLSGAAAAIPLVLFCGVFATLVSMSARIVAPRGALHWISSWSVGGLLWTTLLTSAVALMVAVPVSISIATILAYRVRGRVSWWMSLPIEFLTTVPGVMVGIWALVVVVPHLRTFVQPLFVWLSHAVPWLQPEFVEGYRLLSISLVLALLAAPLITVTVRDLLLQVPELVREAGLSVGMTDWQIVRHVSLPHARRAVVGCVLLGWSRALGEAVAVWIVGGGILSDRAWFAGPGTLAFASSSAPVNTVASMLLERFLHRPSWSNEALQGLALLALVLFILTLLTNGLALAFARQTRPFRPPTRRGER
jgi:phosphate transport system permease protein